MHIRFNLLLIFLLYNIFLLAQDDAVLFTVNNNKIYLNEFEHALMKSNVENKMDKAECRDFLNQYIEFKLKVSEAEKQRLDKRVEFTSKVQNFKKQLILPYLTDNKYIEKLTKEAYERMKTEIRVRQILIKVSPYAAPKDTIIAYEKALNVKKKLIDGAEFQSLAVAVSDDFSTPLNMGDLWYIGPFKLPYRIENYIYGRNQLKISAPLRSELGYHVIEILDRRPYQGRLRVAHIMIALPADTNAKEQEKAKQKIFEVYKKLQNGQDFKQLAIEYSDDKGASLTGGELPYVTTGNMEHEFEEACYKLSSDGAISKPILTSYGWHIIKRISKEELPTFKDMQQQIENKVMNSERGKLAKKSALESIKSNNNFKDFHDFFGIYEALDTTIFEANWKKPELANLDDKLFEFNNRSYYQKDFAYYLENSQKEMFPIPIENYVNLKYNDFIEDILFNFEAEEIEKDNPQIASQIKEFSDNILAYEVLDQQVWSKLSKAEGIQDYFDKHKDDYNKKYQADVSIYKYSNDLRKIEKRFKKIKKQHVPEQELIARIKATTDMDFDLIQNSTVEEGQDQIIDKVIEKYKSGALNKGEKFVAFENDKIIVWLNSEIKKTNKTFADVKDIVIIDYRHYLLQKWMQKLKSDYKVTINENTFESIFSN